MTVRRKRPINSDGTPLAFDHPDVAHNVYWHPWSLPSVRRLLEHLQNNHVVLIYGEVYGGSVQSLNYDIPKGRGLGFAAFDILIDGNYLDYDRFSALCNEYGVPMVPLLYRGPWNQDKAFELADGPSTMASHMREGVVVKPIKERIDPKVGRAVVKIIGVEYSLSKHKAKDNTDT